jgi:hypothetical protein
VRRHRVWIVGIFVGTLVFAQAAAAAHACALLSSSMPAQPIDASAPAMDPGCAGMAAQSHSTVNVCVSHCVGSDQSNANADVPAAAVPSQPALTVRLYEVSAAAHTSPSSLVSPAAAPPPHLRFARLLI